MICSVFGHRDIEDDINEIALYNFFKGLLVDKGITTFYFGGFGDFDALCHKLISCLKADFPYIRRVYCLTDERHLRPNKRPAYLTEETYEDFIFLAPDFNGWYKRIYFRNLEMIKASDFILFYAKPRPDSGAYKAYLYAKKQKTPLLNIVEERGYLK